MVKVGLGRDLSQQQKMVPESWSIANSVFWEDLQKGVETWG